MEIVQNVTSTKDDKLVSSGMLPCPYCEEAWIYVSDEFEYKSKCMCGLAYRSLPWAATKDEAKENWNRLVTELNYIIPKIIRKRRK